MQKKMILFMAIATAAILVSCKKENACDCFKRTGKDIKVSRPAGEFHSIRLDDGINLFFSQDAQYSITVEGGENLLPLIRTEIEGQTLIISNENSCNWVRSYNREINVTVTAPELTSLEYSGYGDISFTDTLKTDIFTIDCREGSGSIILPIHARETHFNMHTGPADLTVTGVSDHCYVYAVGNGSIHLENLFTRYAYIQNRGTGDFYIYVQDEMVAIISWTGNVYYYGNPVISYQELSGQGELIHLY